MKEIIKYLVIKLCPICLKTLEGEGSIQEPYQCKCGEWKYNPDGEGFSIVKKTYHYKIK